MNANSYKQLEERDAYIEELRDTLTKIKSLLDDEPFVILELDDATATDGLHLRDYQRQPLLEKVWARAKEIKKLVGGVHDQRTD